MGTLTVNSHDYEDMSQIWTPGTGAGDQILQVGSYYTLPPWGDPPRIGSEERDVMIVSFPGVDGVWRKNMGFRGRPITITMISVDVDKENVWGRVDDLMGIFEQFERFSIILPDEFQVDGCALVPGAGTVLDEFAIGNGGGDVPYIAVVSQYQFRQYSYNNT